MNRIVGVVKPLRVFENADHQRALDHLGSALANVQRSVVVDGNLLEGVALSTTDTEVHHGLGRKPRGWVVVDQDADARVWRSVASTSSTLTLQASASVTINLWVF